MFRCAHFDLATNYGPNPGSAERNPGRILREELGAYRDELVISTKAGYEIWDGPYGNWGSRKHILASLDQSLQRMGLPYVDIFYHHHMDSNTPLEETMSALAQAVTEGKALYVGLSNYDGWARRDIRHEEGRIPRSAYPRGGGADGLQEHFARGDAAGRQL